MTSFIGDANDYYVSTILWTRADLLQFVDTR